MVKCRRQLKLRMRGSWTPSIVPTGYGLDIYLVLDDFGPLGRAYPETDPERPIWKPSFPI